MRRECTSGQRWLRAVRWVRATSDSACVARLPRVASSSLARASGNPGLMSVKPLEFRISSLGAAECSHPKPSIGAPPQQILVALGVPPVCATPVPRTTKVLEAAGIVMARAQGPGSALVFRALSTAAAHTGGTPALPSRRLRRPGRCCATFQGSERGKQQILVAFDGTPALPHSSCVSPG